MSSKLTVVVVWLWVLESDLQGVGHVNLLLITGLLFNFLYSLFMLLLKVAQLFHLLSAASSRHANCCQRSVGRISLPEVSEPQAELVVRTDDYIVEIELV